MNLNILFISVFCAELALFCGGSSDTSSVSSEDSGKESSFATSLETSLLEIFPTYSALPYPQTVNVQKGEVGCDMKVKTAKVAMPFHIENSLMYVFQFTSSIDGRFKELVSDDFQNFSTLQQAFPFPFQSSHIKINGDNYLILLAGLQIPVIRFRFIRKLKQKLVEIVGQNLDPFTSSNSLEKFLEGKLLLSKISDVLGLDKSLGTAIVYKIPSPESRKVSTNSKQPEFNDLF